MITIIDYGAGNLRSVKNALASLGAEYEVVTEPKFADAVIFPGVGSFDEVMKGLEKFKKPLLDYLNSGKPFLGICIGLQALFEGSEEGSLPGLGFFKGRAEKLNAKKLPQIGWNLLNFDKNCKLFKNIPENPYVYFVNSFAVLENENSSATCDYGTEFTAAVCKGNVFATQFHPEKSGAIGLQMLKNFLEVVNEDSSSN